MYQVKFVDDTEFTGGEPENSMWDMLPNKPIKSILYWLNEDDKFLFSDMEEYNHMVEHQTVFQNGQPIRQDITRVIVMGRIKQRVYEIIYDIKRGTLQRICVPYGQEYSHEEKRDPQGNFLGWANGFGLKGWKFGVIFQENDYPGPKLKRFDKDGNVKPL